MTIKTWTGGHAGDPNSWDEPLNWIGGAIPVNTDDVVIATGAFEPVLARNTANLNSVKINTGAGLTVGTFTLNSGSGGVKLLGAGSTITVTGGVISDPGAALTLATGSVLTASGTVIFKTITGTGKITASGGTLNLTGAVASGVILTIDAGSASDLNILTASISNSAITINNSNQTLEIGTDLTITSAENITNGTIRVDDASLTDTAGITLGTGSTLIGSGVIIGSTSGLSGSGVVEASSGVLELKQSVGTTNLNFKIDDTLGSDGTASTLQLDDTVGSGNTFTFLGATGDLALTSAPTFNAAIAGLNVGSDLTPTNFLDISSEPGVTIASGATGSGTSGTVTLSDGDTLNLSGITGSPGTWFADTTTDGTGGTDIFLSSVVCFTAGTCILTATGEKTIESLIQGDIVITRLNKESSAQAIKWIGQRRINLTTHPRPEMVAPVRIERGAIADDLPHRDLLVSPDHAIYIDGKLICTRQLINGTTIRQETNWPTVEYFHIELENHAILLAEGLPTESYLNTGNDGFFANAHAPLILHRDLTDGTDFPTRETASCAPFVWDEDSVRPIWQRLADRSAVLGRPLLQPNTITDPDLRVIADGRTLWPLHSDDGQYFFVLPYGTTEVCLVSHAGSPTDICPWLEDRRRLGVRVGRMVLRNTSNVIDVPLDHPNLSEGWWAVERDGMAMRRSTNGEAVVPLPVLPERSPTMLEIYLADKMTYVVAAKLEAEPETKAA